MYPDNSEILETWNWYSSFKYFRFVRIEKQIRLFLGRSYGLTILFQDLLIFRMFALWQSFCKTNDKFTKTNSVLWAVCLKVLVSLTFSKGLTGYLLHTAEWICGLWQARTRWQIAKIMILLSGLHTRTYKLEECYRDLICSVNKIISCCFLTFSPFFVHYS